MPSPGCLSSEPAAEPVRKFCAHRGASGSHLTRPCTTHAVMAKLATGPTAAARSSDRSPKGSRRADCIELGSSRQILRPVQNQGHRSVEVEMSMVAASYPAVSRRAIVPSADASRSVKGPMTAPRIGRGCALVVVRAASSVAPVRTR